MEGSRVRIAVRLIAGAFAAMLALAPCGAHAKGYSIRSWSTGHGLESRGFGCCMVSRDGTVWIGAIGGLIRFDGVEFDRVGFDLAKAFSGDRITALWEDGSQRIWCGYETGDIVVYDRRSGVSRLIPLRWERQTIRAIHADPLGDIWLILDDHRLVRIRDGWATPFTPGSEHSGGYLGFVTTRAGKLLAEYSGLIFEWEKGTSGGRWVRIDKGDGYVSFVVASRKGGTWLVNGDMAIRKTEAGVVAELRRVPVAGNSQVLETASGNLLVATLGNGIYSVSAEGHIERYGLKDGLCSRWVVQMAEDRFGNVVAVSPDGVSVLGVSEAQTVPGLGELGGARLTGVTGTQGGDLWVGTEGAGVFRIRAGKVQRFGLKDGLTNEFVWSILDEGQAGVWVGSWGGGLYHRQNGHFDPVANSTGFGRWIVTAILRARDGSLWIGTNGGIGNERHATCNWYSRSGGAKLAIVRCLAQGQHDRIWFGTYGQGAGYIEGSKVKLLDPKARTSCLFASALLDDGTGGVWIGSSGEGLYHWKDGVWMHITSSDGLPSNDIFHIDDDGRGRLWFTSSAGVYSIRKSDLDAVVAGISTRVFPVTINGDDGLPSNQCAGGTLNAAYMDRNDKYFVPTTGGLAVIDTRKIHAQSQVLYPEIVKVAIDDRPCVVSEGHPLVASPQTQSISVKYTAPTLVHPELVEFAYRLDGEGKSGWVNLGHSRHLLLQRMSPGAHWLEISAQNPSSRTMGPPVRLEIIQKPFVTETLWFRGLLAVGAVALLTFLVWMTLRRRYLRVHRKLELETALEKERRRIARDIHDDLGAHLAQVMLLSQADDPRGDPASRKMLFARIHSKAKEITKAFDELVWAVNPSHDTIESFVSYAMRIAQETISAAGIRCRLRIPESMPPIPFGSGTRHHLILCMKEAIANALKHASCTQIEVRLEIEQGRLRLTVSDDGSGFDVGLRAEENVSDADHSGLFNLNARMRELNGTMHLASTPGKGTQVTFECPL